jgi:capsular exopolysaccharide synthesis family protein
MKETFHTEDSIIKDKVEEEIVLNKQLDIKKIKNLDKRLIEVWKEDSLEAEQYRILRTYILKAVKNNESKIFLISSAVHCEGKTLTATNLAISIARGLDESVLLIDADLRKPNASSMLGIEKETRGLAEYLIDGGEYINYVTKTSIPKLSLIPPGSPPHNPSELIHSKHMINLIKQIKNQFDNQIVIIDAPPLIPVTDSIILSSLADAVIIVIKASETQREMVNEAIDKIGNKKKILGLILNGCEFSKARYNYYYHYLKDKKE